MTDRPPGTELGDDEAPGLALSAAVPAAAAGGVLGALGRYGLSVAVDSPWSTLVVNLLGCVLLGLLVGARRDALLLRAFAGTGVLGGFTTMSTFAVETDRLAAGPASAYVLGSVLGGAAAAAVGLRAGGRLA